jgi:uncharacterized protein YecE (DUF72 family)
MGKKGIGPTEWFNYPYSKDELRELVPKMKVLAEKTRELHVSFDNCCSDKTVDNARRVARILG